MRKFLLLVGFLPLVACGFATKGESGNARFQYTAELFGGAVDQPIMVGADEPMSAKTTDVAAREITTSDATVIQITKQSLQCERSDGTFDEPISGSTCPSGTKSVSLSFHAHALRSGSATLQLLGAGGQTIDSLTISAVEASSVSFVGCADGSKPNTSCALGFEVRDAGGRQLQASSGVRFTTSDFAVVGFLPAFGQPVATVDAERGFLRETNMITRGPGTATVTAVAPSGAKLTKTLRVVP
jgi:hypothetical protein